MRHALLLTTIALSFAFACDSVPVDDQRADSRLFPARGVIRGTVVYQGPHPCSRAGHIVGNAILLFFDRTNPPPPAGLATTAVNFGVVTGDALFANEPRSPDDAVYCPKDHGVTDTVTVSAPFAVSPFDAATYIVQGFFDATGDFLPTFKFRNLPEAGDIGGGYLDTQDAAKHAGDPNYRPIFLPVDVGVAPPGAQGGASRVIPKEGFVADNVTVTLGAPLPLARPYFFPDGANAPALTPTPTSANPSGDPSYVPVVQMAQDIHILAPPAAPSPAAVVAFQRAFPVVKLNAGVAPNEAGAATDPAKPFHFQLAPTPKPLFIWSSGQLIPEGNGVPLLYPLVIFQKLVDDPSQKLDPQSLGAQGGASGPVVVILGITLGTSDTLFGTVLGPPGPAPSDATRADHVTALIRPTALCIDPAHIEAGAVLVTPFLTAPSADPNEVVPPEGKPIFDAAAVTLALSRTFGKVTIQQGCLPTGRYAINAVYPTGQAWTVPNETGSCAPAEGPIDPTALPLPRCTTKPRDVLYSQGTRGVLEVTPSPGSPACAQFPVPPACRGAP